MIHTKNRNNYIFVFFMFVLFIILNKYVSIHSKWDAKSLSLFRMLTIPFIIPLLLASGRIVAVLTVPFIFSFSLFEVYLSIKYEEITPMILQAIGGTNQHEALSMLLSNGVFPPIILFLSFIGFSALVYKYSFPNKIIFSISAVVVIIISTIAWQKTNEFAPERQRSNLVERGRSLRHNVRGIIGDMIYVGSIFFSNDNQPVLPHPKSDPSIEGKSDKREKNIIIIVGESAFSGRHSVYGYTKFNTTPYMKALSDEKKLCAVTDAHSGANITRSAVPMLLSFFEPLTQDKLYKEKNLVELAHDNGYQTSWISSQDGMGEYARPFGYISEYSDFLVRDDYKGKENHVDWHDESLLPIIEQRFSTTSPYKFIVIHIMGSHRNYSDYVKPEDIRALPDANAYDQSLHRTDRILHQIIQMADEKLKDYTLLYISDHGEIVDNKVEGHGLQYGSTDQYKVPFYIKSNNDHYCQEANNMKNYQNRYSAIMTKFIILDMMGYKIDPNVIKGYYNHDYVLHSDGVVYEYDNLPHK